MRRHSIAMGLLLLASWCAHAHAQSEGFDGLALSGGTGSWQCNKIRIPANASARSILITGTATSCTAGGCTNATGDADLYVYNTSATGGAPSSTAGGWTCRPYLDNSNETCSVGDSSSDAYYWACVHGYSAFTTIQVRSKYGFGNPNENALATDGSTVEYMDFWKNNLFLSIAYHRIGCLTGSSAVLTSQDYDGFSTGDFCRAGQGWQSPSQFGSQTSYQVSLNLEAIYGVMSFDVAKQQADKCANGGTLADGRTVSGTNNFYGTAEYAYRSSTCSYNVLTNCNSDCWIRHFSDCLDGGNGSGIAIASPCW